MTSTASPKEKPPIFAAPTRLTPSEIESLRAHKRELTRQLDETRAAQGRKAARDAAAD